VEQQATQSIKTHLYSAICRERIRVAYSNGRDYRLSVHVYNRQFQTAQFLRATAVPAGTAVASISYGDSVRLPVRLSRPGGEPSPGEIETPGLHHMIA